jgi:hypothetical protein
MFCTVYNLLLIYPLLLLFRYSQSCPHLPCRRAQHKLVQHGKESPVGSVEGVRDGGTEHRVEVGPGREREGVQEDKVVDGPEAKAKNKKIK